MPIRLPYKPGVSCILAHYLSLIPPKSPEYDNKLHEIFSKLFQVLTFDRVCVTQYMMILRCMLYFICPPELIHTSYLRIPQFESQYAKAQQDPILEICKTFIDSVLPKDILDHIYNQTNRAIGGGPFHSEVYASHRTQYQSFVSSKSSKLPIFDKWTKIANKAGDSNITFKTTILGNLKNSELRKRLIELKLKQSSIKSQSLKKLKKPQKTQKPQKLATSSSSSSSTKPTKRKYPFHRFPQPSENGWVAVLSGASMCNFVSNLTPTSTKHMSIQIMQSPKGYYVMCLHAKVKGVFILQASTRISLFRNYDPNTLPPPIFFNTKDSRIVTKNFIQSEVCLQLQGSNLYFSGTGLHSSLTLILPVNISPGLSQTTKSVSVFKAIAKNTIPISFLKPLITIKATSLTITCELDRLHNKMFMTFTTSKTSTQIRGIYRFMGDLITQSTSSSTLSTIDNMGIDIPLFKIDTSQMYRCTLVSKKDETRTTLERTYQNSRNYIEVVFNTTYALSLLKNVIRKMACDESLCFILTQERMLLYTLNQYKGSIQVGQVPLKKQPRV